ALSDPPQALWIEGAPPSGAPLRAGERLRLRCLARGGHPPPRLAWTKDGRPFRDGRQAPVAAGSLTGRELALTLAPGDHGAAYGCEAAGDPRGDPPRALVRLRVLCEWPP
ncbi:NPHN protein, partial [Piaya cayana]|nr:NPHN protein [Piaya cayana]